jgi:hypothetical protein
MAVSGPTVRTGASTSLMVLMPVHKSYSHKSAVSNFDSKLIDFIAFIGKDVNMTKILEAEMSG